MRRWLSLVFALLLAFPAVADMYQDGSNAKFPEAREKLGITSGCDPVAEFGADPTGATDAAPAINQCAALIRNGVQSNVSLPVGIYRVNSQVTLTKAQTLSGAGRGATTLMVYSNFDPAAEAVIKLTPGGMDTGAEVRDLGVYFQQADGQASRAAYQPLGSCTAVYAGTGCKYPPAFLLEGARTKLKDVRIARAWKGIVVNNSAAWIENIEMSALDTGIEAGVAATIPDWNHYRGINFWPFDIIVGTPIYDSVFNDGNTVAARFGGINGLNVSDLSVINGRVIIDGDQFWGYFDGLSLDAGNSGLEVVRVAQPGLRISNMYTTGDANPNTGGCKTTIGPNAGFVQITNAFFQGGANPQTFVCVNGRLLIDNSYFLTGAGTQKAVSARGGYTELRGSTFLASTAMTVPMVETAGGALIATGNHFQVDSGFASIHVAADNPAHYIANNNTKNWPVTFGFGLGGSILGYYDLGDQGFTTTVTPAFDTPGNSVLNVTAQGSGFALRGDYVEGSLNVTFGSNAYTTASGAFRLKVNGMPTPAPGNATSCALHLMEFIIATSAPMCSADPLGFVFYKVNSAAATTAFSTAEVPPSWAGMAIRLGWRYRIR